MATNANPYVVNIVELQNIALSITGTNAVTDLQQDMSNIKQMVLYDTKTIATDVLSNYTLGQDIQVLANLNFSNTSIYYNSNVVSLQTQTSTISTFNTGITTSDSASTITFTVAGDQSLLLTSTGMLQYTQSPTYFSTGVDIAGWLYVSESAFVKNLYQTSDQTLKQNIEPFFTTINDVLKLQPRRFNWISGGESDIGFIAQEVKTVWPDLTTVDAHGTMGLAYSRFIPLLLESIRELNLRVSVLEEHLRTKISS